MLFQCRINLGIVGGKVQKKFAMLEGKYVEDKSAWENEDVDSTSGSQHDQISSDDNYKYCSANISTMSVMMADASTIEEQLANFKKLVEGLVMHLTKQDSVLAQLMNNMGESMQKHVEETNKGVTCNQGEGSSNP